MCSVSDPGAVPAHTAAVACLLTAAQHCLLFRLLLGGTLDQVLTCFRLVIGLLMLNGICTNYDLMYDDNMSVSYAHIQYCCG